MAFLRGQYAICPKAGSCVNGQIFDGTAALMLDGCKPFPPSLVNRDVGLSCISYSGGSESSNGCTPLFQYIGDTESEYCWQQLFDCAGELRIYDVASQTLIAVPGDVDLSSTITPGINMPSEYDKEDLRPLRIDGPFPSTDLATLFAQALAHPENTTTTFSQEGSAITLADLAECGSVSVTEMGGMKGVILDGHDDKPVAGHVDNDGVRTSATIGVVDDCCVLVNFCVKKKFTPAKA